MLYKRKLKGKKIIKNIKYLSIAHDFFVPFVFKTINLRDL